MIREIRREKGGLGLTATVASHTIPDKDYTVVRSSEGEWRCTCPQNFIRKVECKHIDETMTEVYRRDLMRGTREPRLFIVQFSAPSVAGQVAPCIGDLGYREAVVIATTTEGAKETFLRAYSCYRRLRVISVVETDREVLVR